MHFSCIFVVSKHKQASRASDAISLNLSSSFNLWRFFSDGPHPTCFQKLEDKLQKLNQKVKKYDSELIRLKRVKKDHEDAMKRYQGLLSPLKTS